MGEHRVSARRTSEEADALDVFIQLTRAAERVMAELQPALGAERLTAGQLGVLEAIASDGPLSLRELGGRLFRSAPNMTIVVDNLESDGLVRRVRSDTDRRVVLVESTVEGRRRFRRAYPPYQRVIATFMATLAPSERTRLVRLCRKLREQPSERPPHAGTRV